jgi:hypothetical protein
VRICERWIIAVLRNRKFFSLQDLNQAIRELLVGLNERPFRKRDGSRASLFQTLEKPALAPLPTERFDLSQWARITVNIDYHIAFDGNFYSVPYTLVQHVVEVRSRRFAESAARWQVCNSNQSLHTGPSSSILLCLRGPH